MSVNLSLLAAFAAPAKVATKRVFDLSLDEARELASNSIKVGKTNEAGVTTVSVRCGKRALNLAPIFAEHKKEEVSSLAEKTITSLKVTDSEKLEQVQSVLYSCVVNGSLDGSITEAQEAAKTESESKTESAE